VHGLNPLIEISHFSHSPVPFRSGLARGISALSPSGNFVFRQETMGATFCQGNLWRPAWPRAPRAPFNQIMLQTALFA
jgi:hypothetical protein